MPRKMSRQKMATHLIERLREADLREFAEAIYRDTGYDPEIEDLEAAQELLQDATITIKWLGKNATTIKSAW